MAEKATEFDNGTNTGMETTKIIRKKATSQTLSSQCARKTGIQFDFKHSRKLSPKPEYIPTFSQMKKREEKPIHVRFNKGYIFKSFSKSLEMKSTKAELMKIRVNASRYSKAYTPTQCTANTRISTNHTILKNEDDKMVCKEIVTSNLIQNNSIVDLFKKSESNQSAGFREEDNSELQTLPHQGRPNNRPDHTDVESPCSFILYNKISFFMSILILCLSIAFFSEKQDTSVFHSSMCFKSKRFGSTFQITITPAKCDNQKEISDSHTETLDNFLTFVLSQKMENLQCEQYVSELLLAYKHHIGFLKPRCISQLISRISVTNVCDMLLISGAIRSIELWRAAHNFVCLHVDDVFASNEWKNYIMDYPELAAFTVNYLSTCKNNKKPISYSSVHFQV